LDVKFLYCPNCKELRVKPWYAIRDSCARCRDAGRVIEVPRSILTYMIYILTAAAFALIFVHTREDNNLFLYTAVALVVVMMVIQFKELARGEKYARSKIKVTKSDKEALRKKGWT
jgi:membrane protein YdbS with pleckstrin-like domain